jgi:hypothetical protein|tara:strand:+ start:106 stop:399 length:294 start_codon:yes stop_codon:yes gene_type:complete
MRKKKVNKKEDKLHKIVDKYMKQFDKLMNNASDDINKLDYGCSSHVISSLIIRHCSSNMTRYYDVIKIKELFQEILDEESTAAVIKAKSDREEAVIN